MPANWGARYPRRRNHPTRPTRPRVRLDAIGRPSPSSSSLLLTLGAPLAIVENSGKHSPAQLAGKGDTSSGVDSTRSRAVRFDSVIKLVLVPARSDLGERTKDLWWQEEDYFQFKMGALMDGSAYGLRRNLRNRAFNPLERLPVELRSLEPRPRDRAYPHPVEIAQALQRVDHTGPIHSPSIPAVKRRALSQRAQPPTPPSSPTSASTPTASNDDDAQDSSVFFPKGEWSYVEDYDGSVGVCGLPA